MLFSVLGVNEDVINEDDHKFVQGGEKTLFIRSMETIGALVTINGITRNP